MLDFNRSVMSAKAASVAINERIDAALVADGAAAADRAYLGASSVGHECLRRIQWDWTAPAAAEGRVQRIFARGHWFEAHSAQCLQRAGFVLRRERRAGGPIGFSVADGRFRGHCDGVLVDGPPIEGLRYPALWEHKALGAAGWRKLEREGLRKAYPHYYAQVQLYMAYLDLSDGPALFTAANADTCELLHLLVPFDPKAAQEASDRAVAVIRAVEAGELLPKLTEEPGDWRCRMCVFRERCWAGA